MISFYFSAEKKREKQEMVNENLLFSIAKTDSKKSYFIIEYI